MRGRERLAILAIGLALAAAVLPVAGATRIGAIIGGSFGILAAIPFVTSRRIFENSPPLLHAIGLLFGATLLQIVPLPALVVSWLSPETYEVVTSVHALALQEPPSWIALSLDPPATAIELARIAGYFGVTYAALRVAAHRHGRRRLRSLAGALGAVLLAIALAHFLVGERSELYGIYRPETYAPAFLTPFININHLAGILIACAWLLTGLAIDARTRELRIALACGALIYLGASLLVPSRGAILALLAGSGVMTLRAIRSSNRGAWRPSSKLTAGVIVAVIIALFIGLGGDISDEFTRTNAGELSDEESKFGAWKNSLQLVADFPLTGIGRGAFEPVFPHYHEPSNERVYAHVENEYLRTIIDHGVILGPLILSLLCWCVWRAFRQSRQSWAATGTMAAVVALLAQNFFDFSLALSGGACFFLVILSTLSIEPAVQTQHVRRSVGIRAGSVAIGCVAVVLAATTSELREDRAAILSLDMLPATELESAVWPNIRRHPADGLAAASVARALLDTGSPRAFPYLNWALDRYPSHPGTHHLAARLLRAAGKSEQALIEYQLAIRYSEGRQKALVLEVIDNYPPQMVARGMPTNVENVTNILEILQTRSLSAAVYQYSARLDAAGRSSVETNLVGAKAALEVSRPTDCARLASKAISRGAGVQGKMVLADCLIAQNRLDEAARLLMAISSSSSYSDERVGALGQLAALLERQGKLLEARDTYNKITHLAFASNRTRASAHDALARVEERLGNPNRAKWEAERARKLLESEGSRRVNRANAEGQKNKAKR